MELLLRCQALNGGDVRPQAGGEHQTGESAFAIHQNGAGAALT